MTTDQNPVTGPSDDVADRRTLTVLPGTSHRLGRGSEDGESDEPTDGVDRDIRAWLPMQRTPGSGPFGPTELWDVMYRPEFYELLQDRLSSGEHLALVAFGMDQFGELNVTAGPEAGDVALRNAYRVLRWMLGPGNVAYFGSDCFAALLSYDDETTANRVEGALDRLAQTDLSDRLTGVFATASAGMVIVEHPETTADNVLYEAECALLAAKETGANRVVVERLSDRTDRAESA